MKKQAEIPAKKTKSFTQDSIPYAPEHRQKRAPTGALSNCNGFSLSP
jgi:hypothetical protein